MGWPYFKQAGLAVIGLLAFFLASCYKDLSGPQLQATFASADSAIHDSWARTGEAVHHSPLYDSIYHYIAQAVVLEFKKRTLMDSVNGLAVLSPARLRDSLERADGIDVIRSARDSLITWNAKADSLFSQYSHFLSRKMDSLTTNPTILDVLSQHLLRREFFIPSWRVTYDSIEASTLRTYQDFLMFIDTNASVMQVDTTLRFSDPSKLPVYNAIAERLDSLSRIETALLQRIPVNDSLLGIPAPNTLQDTTPRFRIAPAR